MRLPPIRRDAIAVKYAVARTAPAERLGHKFGWQVVAPIQRYPLERLAVEKIAGKAGGALGEARVRRGEVDPAQHPEGNDVVDRAEREFPHRAAQSERHTLTPKVRRDATEPAARKPWRVVRTVGWRSVAARYGCHCHRLGVSGWCVLRRAEFVPRRSIDATTYSCRVRAAEGRRRGDCRAADTPQGFAPAAAQRQVSSFESRLVTQHTATPVVQGILSSTRGGGYVHGRLVGSFGGRPQRQAAPRRVVS